MVSLFDTSPYSSSSFAPNAPIPSLPPLLDEQRSVIDAKLSLYTNATSQQLALETYFAYCHNQPYSFFHESSFRAQVAYRTIPQYLTYALVVLTLRYTSASRDDPNASKTVEAIAKTAWRAILTQCFETDEGPDYRTVQATTLLAIHEFIECKHRLAWIKIGLAASMAQSLQMMKEPPLNLPTTTREEHRRTLWSIYLLDRLATCGQNRTPVFHDFSLRLRLPCTEEAFQQSLPSNAPTMQEFHGTNFTDLSSASPFARVVLVTSTLSQIAHVALQQSQEDVHWVIWDQGSKHMVIHARLISFATFFGASSPIAVGASNTTDSHFSLQVFARIIYHLCHCVLQHPFVLRQQWKTDMFGPLMDFSTNPLLASWEHAQSLTDALFSATHAGLPVWASFYGYCSLVSGTINALHSHSGDEIIRIKSQVALERNVHFLQNHARVYRNASRMLSALVDFIKDAESSKHLISTSPTGDRAVTAEEAERLNSLLDYGLQSTRAVF